MQEHPYRWVNNGLPRKGWLLQDVEDTECLDTHCEWCGTLIRYVHYIHHPEEDVETICGCVCAENLTQDYINPRKREKMLRLAAAKLKRQKKREKEQVIFLEQLKKQERINFPSHFRESKKGNLFFNYKGMLIIIFGKCGSFKLRIGEIWGKKTYSLFSDAAKAAYDYLNK